MSEGSRLRVEVGYGESVVITHGGESTTVYLTRRKGNPSLIFEGPKSFRFVRSELVEGGPEPLPPSIARRHR